MIEEFKMVEGFEDYRVSNYGRVFNDYSGREMVLSPTMYGDLSVGMYRHGQQFRRSVKGLVARAFVPGEDDVFDTPILLDGDRHNLKSTNILWRPRWFALKYIRQITDPHQWQFQGPIIDVTHRIEYQSIMEAAMLNGLLCADIRRSIIEGRRVFPNGETYASSFI